jgi:uncharacterized membrane protein
MKLKDWLVLIVPVAVIALIMLIPAVPRRIPMQFNLNGEANWYLPKWALPVAGIIPFLIYLRHKKR